MTYLGGDAGTDVSPTSIGHYFWKNAAQTVRVGTFFRVLFENNSFKLGLVPAHTF